MTWNMRGSNSAEKLQAVKRLVEKFNLSIVALQETKRGSVNAETARLLWGVKPHEWCYSPASGFSGGLLILWNSEQIEVHDTIYGDFSLTIQVSLRGSNLKWALSVVYGPCDPRQKFNFWKEVDTAGQKWGLPWVLCGDFNAIRC